MNRIGVTATVVVGGAGAQSQRIKLLMESEMDDVILAIAARSSLRVGRGKPALMVFRYDETKNEEPLEFELPQALSDRLYAFRNEITVAVIGHRSDVLFAALSLRASKLRSSMRAARSSMLNHPR